MGDFFEDIQKVLAVTFAFGGESGRHGFDFRFVGFDERRLVDGFVVFFRVAVDEGGVPFPLVFVVDGLLKLHYL